MLQLEQAILMRCLSTCNPGIKAADRTATGIADETKQLVLDDMAYSCSDLIFVVRTGQSLRYIKTFQLVSRMMQTDQKTLMTLTSEPFECVVLPGTVMQDKAPCALYFNDF